MTRQLVLLMGALIVGCSTTVPRRVVVDSSNPGEGLPTWARENRVSWEENGQHYYKVVQTIRGDQRLGACFDVARIEARENLLSQIQLKLRSETLYSTQGTDETDPQIMARSVSSKTQGYILGLRVVKTAYERYQIDKTERVDCYLLTAINTQDFQRLKANLAREPQRVSDRVRDAIEQRQADFLSDGGE